MKPIQLFDTASSTFTYVLFDPLSRDALIIDPVDTQIERDLKLVAELDLKLTWVLETHVHADHVTASGAIRERTGAKTAASAAGAPCVDRAPAWRRHPSRRARHHDPGHARPHRRRVELRRW